MWKQHKARGLQFSLLLGLAPLFLLSVFGQGFRSAETNQTSLIAALENYEKAKVAAKADYDRAVKASKACDDVKKAHINYDKALDLAFRAYRASVALAITKNGQGEPQTPRSPSTRGPEEDRKKYDIYRRRLEDKARDYFRRNREKAFCILAAHTSRVGTAAEIKQQYESFSASSMAVGEEDLFGVFTASTVAADSTETPLNEIVLQIRQGKSLGDIVATAKDQDVIIVASEQLRSEFSRALANPRIVSNCFRPEEDNKCPAN
jgi:hypothetical protein